MEPSLTASQFPQQASNPPNVRTDSNLFVNKSDFRILVIGRAGSGKSTLINLIPNFLYQKNYSNDRMIMVSQLLEIFNPKPVPGVAPKKELVVCMPEFNSQQSDTLSPQDTSQTLKINRYKIDLPNYSVSLIDTPGLENKAHIQNTINEIIKFGQIHAIFYVHKSSDVRPDPIFGDIYTQFSKVLTKIYTENFFVIFTRSNPKLNLSNTQQFLGSYGYPLTKCFRFELSCLTPEWLLRKQSNIQQEQDKLIEAARTSWMASKQEFDSLWKLVQTSSEAMLKVSQTSVRQPSTGSLNQTSVADAYMRGNTGAVANHRQNQSAQEEIYSCSQDVIDLIIKYYSEKQAQEKQKMYAKIQTLLINILTAVARVTDERDAHYFFQSIESRLSIIDRDSSFSPENRTGLRDMFTLFKEDYNRLKAQGAGLKAGAGVQATGHAASQSANANIPALDERGGYLRPAGAFEGVPNVRGAAGSLNPKQLNPQIAHLNFFLS